MLFRSVLWHFHQELLRIRRALPPLAELDKNAMEVTSFANEKVLLVRRWKASSQVLIVVHFGQESTELLLPIPAGRWHVTLDSAQQQWIDQGHSQACETPAVIESRGEAPLTLNPWAFLVFVKSPEINE